MITKITIYFSLKKLWQAMLNEIYFCKVYSAQIVGRVIRRVYELGIGAQNLQDPLERIQIGYEEAESWKSHEIFVYLRPINCIALKLNCRTINIKLEFNLNVFDYALSATEKPMIRIFILIKWVIKPGNYCFH